MNHRTSRLLLGAFLLNLAGAACGGSVYRCGSTYQQTPCAEGRVLEVDDTRSDAQRQDRQAATAADRRLAHDLAAERREREKAVRPQARAAGIPVQQLDQPAPQADDPLCHRRSGRQATWRCRGGQPVYLGSAASSGSR
jgi:hypothetical protein